MTTRPPIPDTIPRLRQRRRADGSWRVWWEPTDEVKALGFDVVELDARRATWSAREARRLNAEVERVRKGGARRTPSRGRTIDNLIDEYRKSSAWKKLRPKTVQSYEGNLRLISRKWGHRLVVDFTKPVMFTWYETLTEASGKHQALALIRMMSILFSHAERIGWRPENTNPCTRLGAEVPKGRTRTAGWPEYDALLTAADELRLPAMALAVQLAALSGATETMLVTATVGEFQKVTIDGADVWAWARTRTKRDTYAVLEVHPYAVPALEAAIAGRNDPDAPLLLDGRTGRAYSADLFRKRWAEIRAVAARTCPSLGRPPLQFRDLRRTFGHWARAGGASTEDTGDVLGNSAAVDPRLREVYMATQFATARRAVLAIERPAEDGRKRA
jgi:integrase